MEQKTLSIWLKCVIAGVGLCGLVVYLLALPACGGMLRDAYPEFSNRYWPWLIFLWVTGIPCYGALVLGWKIAGSIGRDRSFSEENARRLGWVSMLAAGDAAFFFAGNVLLLFLNMSHPGVLLASLGVVFAGAAVSVTAAALSHLVKKAAILQEQSDWTI